MSSFTRTCVCCGEEYFDRGKDSLCDKCDGSGFRQNEHKFTGKVVDSLSYEFQPTESYFKNKFKKKR